MTLKEFYENQDKKALEILASLKTLANNDDDGNGSSFDDIVFQFQKILQSKGILNR